MMMLFVFYSFYNVSIKYGMLQTTAFGRRAKFNAAQMNIMVEILHSFLGRCHLFELLL